MLKYLNKQESGGIESESSRTDMIFSPVFGAEYWCCGHVSFGGEVQFNYVNVGQWENGGHEKDESVSIMKIKGLFFIRWWF